MAVNLITFSGSNVLPEYDAEARKGMTGFTTMPSVTLTGSNLLHITECYGMIAGYQFGIDTMDVAVSLPASGSVASSLYLHLDTSDIDTPLALTASATPTYQYGSGVYDMEIATFTATPSGVSGLTLTAPRAISNTLIKRNTAYSVGDVVACPSVPAGIMLQCTTAGTSAAVEPVGYQTVVSGGTVTDGTAIFTAFRLNKPQQTTIGEIQMGFSAGRTLLTATEAGSYYFSATIYVPYGPGVASAYLRRASDELYFARQTSVLQSAEYPNYINLSGVIGLAPGDRVVLSLSSPTLSGTCDVTYEIKELV